MKTGLKKHRMWDIYRKVIVLLACIVPVICADAQAWLICNEGFSSRVPQGWTVAPAPTSANRSWTPDTGIVFDGKYAMHGFVPLNSGDTAELVTPWFDCSAVTNVLLYFRHICKTLPSDICQVMYQEQGVGANYRWKPIPMDCYLGASANYKRELVFHHGSYAGWKPEDTLAVPDSTWWKEEGFDLSGYVSYSLFRIKFVIRKGNFAGSYFTKGWYLDAVKVFRWMQPEIMLLEKPGRPTEADRYSLKLKTVSRFGLPHSVPMLHYDVTASNTVFSDSLKMTALAGDSVWSAVFPELPFDAKVKYRVRVTDYMKMSAEYLDSFEVVTSNSVALYSMDYPDNASYVPLQPVCVTLKNKGRNVMQHAIVNWSVNGVPFFPAVYYGNLASGATDTIVIGRYVPRIGMSDTIRVWVKMPNLKEDGYVADDSICREVFGCYGETEGVYTVGDSGHFPDLEKAIAVLSHCGVAGPVTLAMLPGDYSMHVTIPAIPGCSHETPLTITSYTGDSSSVTLRGMKVGGSMQQPLRLDGAAHVRISRISFKPSTDGNCDAIYVSACRDVEVSRCRISAKGGSGVKITGMNTSDVRIQHCRFIGGNYALHASALTQYHVAHNIRFSFNDVDSVNYAIYLQYCDTVVVSNNRVRAVSGYAVNASYCNADVCNNSFTALSVPLSSPYGIRLCNFGDSVRKMGNVCNNVICVDGRDVSGIYLERVSFVRILHNTVCMKTKEGDLYGLNIENSDNRNVMNAEVRNNIFHVKPLSGGGYPVYIRGKNGHVTLGSNNYYHENEKKVPNVGYFGAACRNMDEWWKYVPYDSLSVSELPRYVSDTNLRLSVREGFECPLLYDAPKDVSGAVRNRVTTMGAYEFVPSVSDRAVLFAELKPANDGNYTCRACLKNYGQDTMTAASVAVELNGVVGSPFRWNGLLAPDDTVWVSVGKIALHRALNTLSVWLFSPADGVPANDTVRKKLFVCDTAFTFGENGADFSNLGMYLYYMQSFCGNRPVTLKFKNGNYNKTYNGLTVETLYRKDSSCRLTFCSEAGCADSVILNGVDGLYLRHVSHLTFRDLTFVATANYGAKLIGGIEDVEVSHCVLKSPLMTKSASPKGVMYDNTGNATEYVRSLRLVGNRIVGGCYNIYLNNTAFNRNYIPNSAIVIDSNELSDAANFGLYLVGSNRLVSFSHNRVANYEKSTLSYTGVCLEQNQRMDRMEGNLIRISHAKSAWGVYLGNYLNSNVSNCIMANNYVMVCGEGEKNGVQFQGEAYCNMLHNTVYVSGSTKSRAFWNGNSYTYYGNIMCNLFFADSNACAFDAAYMGFQGKRDYNNYHVRYGDLAFLGKKARTTIGEIREVDKKQDVNSISAPPEWDGSTVVSMQTLLCPKQASVPLDLNGLQREDTTSAGCYERVNYNCDMAVSALLGLDTLLSAGSHGFSVVVENQGKSPVAAAWIHVRINGVELDSTRYSPAVPLAVGCYDTLPLGPYPIFDAINEIVVSISTYRDVSTGNDTLLRLLPYCSMLASDTFRIENDIPRPVLDSLPEIISGCRAVNTVVLVFGNGDYHFSEPWDLSRFKALRLVMVSAAGHRDSVRIIADSSDLLWLGSGLEVSICNLTLEAMKGSVVSIRNYIPLVSVANCRLVSSPTLKSGGLICCRDNIAVGSVRITGNVMEGGCNAVRFSYNTGSVKVQVDSNVMTDQYAYGCYFDHTSLSSCSYNSISVWGNRSNGSFVAVYAKEATVGNIVGNQIRVKECYATGMRLERLNQNTSQQAMVANNIVRVHGIGGATFGLYFVIDRSNICIGFNTFYATAEKTFYAESRACLYMFTSQEAKESILYGNLLVAGSTTVYALRLSTNGSQSVNNLYLDYNCYHVFDNLFYYDYLNVTTIADFYNKTGFEQHGRYGLPNLLGDGLLTLTDNALLVPRKHVGDDFYGKSRNVLTMPGAYEGYLLHTDAALDGFADTSFAVGINNVRVQLRNNGMDTLRSADIAWTFNGLQQPVKHWTGALPKGGSLNVVIGSFVTLCNSLVDLKAYVQSANMKPDSNPYNDTILLLGAACDTSGQSLQGFFAGGHDTVAIARTEAGGWQLGQNIPNPATGKVLLPVTLPEAGMVRLQIYSAEGRLLYRGEHEMPSGRNMLPVDVGGYAAGIYYYSVEYGGERKVRKMTINKVR